MASRPPWEPGDDPNRARAERTNPDEAVDDTLKDGVERCRKDPEFNTRVRQIITEDRELLERLGG